MEEGDVHVVHEVRRVVAGVIVGDGEAGGGLHDGKDCRLEHEAHVRADPQHVLRGERRADGEQFVDEPGAKVLAEEVE